jgi:hypothetical protein
MFRWQFWFLASATSSAVLTPIVAFITDIPALCTLTAIPVVPLIAVLTALGAKATIPTVTAEDAFEAHGLSNRVPLNIPAEMAPLAYFIHGVPPI